MIQDPWVLVKSGRFSEALDAYSEGYRITGSVSDLTNGGLVLLNLGRVEEAGQLFAQAMKIRHDNDYYPLFLGASQWLLEHRSDAIESWLGGLHTKYTDAAGGVQLPGVLLYAAMRVGDKRLEQQSLRLLKKRWVPGRRGPWPAAIAGLHLGQVAPEDLASCLSEQPTVRAREQCQVDFHLGVVALRRQAHEEAYRHMQAAAHNTIALLEVEYYLARGEIGIQAQPSDLT